MSKSLNGNRVEKEIYEIGNHQLRDLNRAEVLGIREEVTTVNGT
jgi:hypothetical protein